jgi:hypothetical protein
MVRLTRLGGLSAGVGIALLFAGGMVAKVGAAVPQNATAPRPELEAVAFSVHGGVFTTNVSLALSAQPSSAVIHYTTDGSNPTEQSGTYSGPIEIDNTTVVKARAFAGEKTSPVGCETYTLLDASLANWSSNLPLVIIDTFGQELTHDNRADVSVRVIDPGAGRASLTGNAAVDSRAFINLHGHSSLRYPKRSYRVKFHDPEGYSSKAAVFGFPKGADWILYAPYPDRTLMRDVIAYEISNAMGRYAPRTRFVEVFLNPTGGKLSSHQYMGVYVFEEKIKRAPARVAIEAVDSAAAEPEISGGYVFKKDHMDRGDTGPPNIGGFPNGGGPSTALRPGYPTGPGGFPADPRGFLPSGGGDGNNQMFVGRSEHFGNNGESFMSPHGSQFLYVEPKADEMTLPQRRWLSQYVRKLEAALYGPDFRDPEKGYAAYLDADSFIDYHLLVETTKNIDGFRFSTFYYKDRGGKLKMGPIWDWNLSFGAANGKQGYMAEHWYWPQLDDQQYSWFRRLFEDPDFAQKYVDRWGQIRTNQFATAKILARADELASLLNEAQARNYRRWRILGRQVWPDYYTGKTYADEVQYMKNWITQRLSWIDRQFISGPSGTESAGKLTLRSPVGKIYYTVDGADPRAAGGTVSGQAQLYKSPVKLAADTVVKARVLEGSHWSWPVELKTH